MKSFTFLRRAAAVAFVGVMSLPPATALAQNGPAWFDRATFEGGITAVLQGTAGNDYGDSKDQTDYAYSADLAVIGDLGEGQSVTIVFESGEGDGANDNIGARSIPNYDSFISNVEGTTTLDVSQAYYEGAFLDGALTLFVGKMDHHSLTDGNEYANDETAQFLNGMFVRMAGVLFAEHENYYAPTVGVVIRPVDLVSLTYTYAKHDGEDLFNNGYQVVELGLHPEFGGLAGNYRFGWLKQDTEHHDIATDEVKANTGFFVSIDQAFMDGAGVFVRYAAQDDTLRENEATSAVSGGLSFDGALWGRPGDGFGLAYGRLDLNKDLVTENNDGESVVEAYYRVAATDYLEITADVQSFSDLERAEKRAVTVYGVRMQAGF